ncbi:MAG TPA: hypothetical protein DEB07_03895 [Candidatus Moranbacteria bacterium]|nr:hypothetical protein [Candidatus Moranbacteria bacterium]HBU25351.1 hypothetical protein [Candidatus Moranbacteria bacterium]
MIFPLEVSPFVWSTVPVFIGAPTLPSGGVAVGSVQARTNCSPKPRAMPTTATLSQWVICFLFIYIGGKIINFFLENRFRKLNFRK